MIYNAVTEYCKKEHIALSEFERRCHLGNGTVGKWRSQNVTPTIGTLMKIEKSTGISVSAWIGGVFRE